MKTLIVGRYGQLARKGSMPFIPWGCRDGGALGRWKIKTIGIV